MTVDQLLAQLDAEAPRTRKALEAVPAGRGDWKPHETSMPFGRLAALVARMPSWISLIVDRGELDLNPPGGGSNIGQEPLVTSADLVRAHDEGVAQARVALARATDSDLEQTWRLLVGGNVVSENRRSIVLRDTFMHLAHHRGQLTVYLRMTGASVPAIYGPSADDQQFA
jgi:uncharacterized damage-inducible protein DinB